jgi:hypothetical protein
LSTARDLPAPFSFEPLSLPGGASQGDASRTMKLLKMEIARLSAANAK